MICFMKFKSRRILVPALLIGTNALCIPLIKLNTARGTERCKQAFLFEESIDPDDIASDDNLIATEERDI